jgi:hypothetical protein
MTTRNINNTNTGLKAFRYNPSLNVIRPTPISPARLDNFVATHKSIFCHANLQLVLETFSHTQQASKYSQSNGAETALTQDGRVPQSEKRRNSSGRSSDAPLSFST